MALGPAFGLGQGANPVVDSAWDKLTLANQPAEGLVTELPKNPADLVRLALRFQERHPGSDATPQFISSFSAVIDRLLQLPIDPAADSSELVNLALQGAELESLRGTKRGICSLLAKRLAVNNSHPATLQALAVATVGSDAEARLLNKILQGVSDEHALPIICELAFRKSPHSLTVEETIYNRTLPRELLLLRELGNLSLEREHQLGGLSRAFVPHLKSVLSVSEMREREETQNTTHHEAAKGSHVVEFLLRNLTAGGPGCLLAQQLFSAVARNVSPGSKILTGLFNLLEQAEARESGGSKRIWRAGFLGVVGEEIRRGGIVSTDLVRALLRQPVSADIDACLMKLVEQPGRAALPATLLLHAYASGMGRLAVAPDDNRTAPNFIPFAPQIFQQGSISGDLKKFMEESRNKERDIRFESLSEAISALNLSQTKTHEEFLSVFEEMAKIAPIPLILGIARQLEHQKTGGGGVWVEAPSPDPWQNASGTRQLWGLPFLLDGIFKSIPAEHPEQLEICKEVILRLFPLQHDFRPAPTPIEQFRKFQAQKRE